MRVTVNQPCPFPALHVINRMLRSDVSVHLSSAQFVRRMKDSAARQNAYEIVLGGERRWLTIPVKHTGKQGVRLRDAEIDYSQEWQWKHLKTIRQAYSKKPYFDQVFPFVHDILSVEQPSLAHLSIQSMIAVFQYLRIDVTMTLDDELPVIDGDPSGWMLAVTKALGGTEYFCGQWAIEYYLDQGAFLDAGVVPIGQNWKCPDGILNVSVIDLLMNHGPLSILVLDPIIRS